MRGAGLRVLVFVVGAACLGAEIAAARLLAPWFGESTVVWANTIATVLVSLSVGYAVGGRVADRYPTTAALSRIVLVAAVLLAAVPFAAEPLLPLSADAFDALSLGGFLGSLAAVCILVAVPILLLGMVSPYAVRLSVTGVAGAGRTTGRLYAISTVGSLVGTFLAALVLIPFVGTRRTFLLFALSLALAALPGLQRRLLALPVPAVVLGLVLMPEGLVKSQSGSGRVIWERETTYQYARVVQDRSGRRTLELDAGHAVHSVYQPGTYLTGGYWDDMLALCYAGQRRPRRVAILGSAAGTTARALGHFSPRTVVDAVELDPDVTEVGRRLFDLHGPRLHLHTADARPWLRATNHRFDAILVDAYRQPYIPFYLTTREFFALAKQRLAPGGRVIVNVGHPAGSRSLERVLTATMASVFGRDHLRRDPADPTNTVLVAGPTAPAAGLRGTAVPTDLASLASRVAARLASPLRGGTVYTDDRAPVEWLVDLSFLRLAD
ncbi:MAG: spermidine synthase [Marmoricola sp.]